MAVMMTLNETEAQIISMTGRHGLPMRECFPSPGEFYLQVFEMINGGDSSVGAIGQVISSDAETADQLLMIANSSIYGFSSEIENMSRAISWIGTRGLRDLMVVGAWGDALSRIAHRDMSLLCLWRHSVHCAILSRLIAHRLRVPYLESLFVSGLLHDIGLFATSVIPARRGGEPAPLAREADGAVGRFGRETDMRHGEIATTLLAEWRLSSAIVEPIVCHHDARRAAKYTRFSAIVQIADAAVQGGAEDAPAYLWRLSGLHRDELPALLLCSDNILEDAMELFAAS